MENVTVVAVHSMRNRCGDPSHPLPSGVSSAAVPVCVRARRLPPEPVLKIAQRASLNARANPACWYGSVENVATNSSVCPGGRVGSEVSSAPSTATAPLDTADEPFVPHGDDVHPVGNSVASKSSL